MFDDLPDIILLCVECLFDWFNPVTYWRWTVAMLLGAGAVWLLAGAIPSRLTGWVCVPIVIIACLLGVWWEARSA